MEGTRPSRYGTSRSCFSNSPSIGGGRIWRCPSAALFLHVPTHACKPARSLPPIREVLKMQLLLLPWRHRCICIPFCSISRRATSDHGVEQHVPPPCLPICPQRAAERRSRQQPGPLPPRPPGRTRHRTRSRSRGKTFPTRPATPSCAALSGRPRRSPRARL